MKKTNKQKQDDIIHSILFYMKSQMESLGCTKEQYWINVKYEEEYYLMGIDEPKIEPDSDDVKAIKKMINCTNEEIESAIKVCLSSQLLTREGAFNGGYCITYQGLQLAEYYETQLEYLKLNPIIRLFKCFGAKLQSKSGIITTILTFAIGLILNALINLDKIIQNWQQFIAPLIK